MNTAILHLHHKAPRMPYKRVLLVFGYGDSTCAGCGGFRLVLGAMPTSTHTSMLILPRQSLGIV